jgi:hypothetical protein
MPNDLSKIDLAPGSRPLTGRVFECMADRPTSSERDVSNGPAASSVVEETES